MILLGFYLISVFWQFLIDCSKLNKNSNCHLHDIGFEKVHTMC